MSPLKSYLVQAVRDWALDHNLTPQILVDADLDGVLVPNNFVQDGRIVFNIHPDALGFYDADDFGLRISARFSGANHELVIPYPAIQAIYARETGKGLVFQDMELDPSPDSPTSGKKQGPTLKVVK